MFAGTASRSADDDSGEVCYRTSMLFRIAFIVIFTSLTVVRLYYRITTGAIRDGVFSSKEGVLPVVLRWILGLPLLYSTFEYVVFPGRTQWMYVWLSTAARVGGVVMGGFAVVLIVLVHRELGSCFSSTLVIREGHKLVRTGPYRYVRHPMYSSYLMLFMGAFLVSGNWVIGLSGTAVIATLMTVRLAREEALLVERFGKEYEEYRSSTGMFIPMTHKVGGLVRAARDAFG